jgi:hypothetical protein
VTVLWWIISVYLRHPIYNTKWRFTLIPYPLEPNITLEFYNCLPDEEPSWTETRSFYKIKLEQACIQLVLILWDAMRRHASLTADANIWVPKQHVQVSEWHVHISCASWKMLKFVNTILPALGNTLPNHPTSQKTLLTVPFHLILRHSSKRFFTALTSNTIPNDQCKSFITTEQESCPPYDRINITFTRYSTALRLSLFTASQLWLLSTRTKLVTIYYSNKLNRSHDNVQCRVETPSATARLHTTATHAVPSTTETPEHHFAAAAANTITPEDGRIRPKHVESYNTCNKRHYKP